MMESRLILLSYLVVCLYLSKFSEACTTVRSLLKTQHNRFYLFSRRGVPGDVTRVFFKKYSTDLANYVNTIAPGQPMGDVCMGWKKRKAFNDQYNTSAVDDMLDTMHSIDPYMFYLPPEQYSDADIMALSDKQQKQVDGFWETAEGELDKPADQVDVRKLSKVPGGLTFFFDPVRTASCKEFDQLVTNTAQQLNAGQVTLEVVALVLRLKLLGIPDDDSLKILAHHVAFSFNGIRCYKQNRNNVPLSRIFFPYYWATFERLTKGMDLSAVPEIPASVVLDRLDWMIRPLSRYESWGKLNFFEFNGEEVHRVHIKDRIFRSDKLDLIRKDIGIASPVTRSESTAPIAVRSSCQSQYYPFSDPPSLPTVICCPVLCQQAHILNVPAFTSSVCCQACYQGSCDTSNSLVNDLATVHVMAYGYMPDTAVTVMI